MKKKRNFYMTAKALVSGFLKLFWRIKIVGTENVPKEGGCVVCANHIAIRDVVILAVSLPRQLRFLGKAELFRVPLIGFIIKKAGACPVDRGGKDVGAIKTMVSLAKSGEMVSLFPQGTRCPGVNPSSTKIKGGAGMIAFRSGATVLPVCIKTKQNRYRFFEKKEVVIGKPIPNEDFHFENGGSEVYTKASKRIMEEICRLGGFPILSETETAPNQTDATNTTTETDATTATNQTDATIVANQTNT